LEEYFVMNVEELTNIFLVQLGATKEKFIEKEEDLDEEENIFVKSPLQILMEMMEGAIFDMGIAR
jgi:hypothetical protein